jgi:hypothetical protein
MFDVIKMLARKNKRFYTKSLSTRDKISKNKTTGQIHCTAYVRNLRVSISTLVLTITVLICNRKICHRSFIWCVIATDHRSSLLTLAQLMYHSYQWIYWMVGLSLRMKLVSLLRLPCEAFIYFDCGAPIHERQYATPPSPQPPPQSYIPPPTTYLSFWRQQSSHA